MISFGEQSSSLHIASRISNLILVDTESCRRYLQDKSGNKVEPEDVLWLFYNTK